jgi:ParB/RepB/Spo0J family partition protein
MSIKIEAGKTGKTDLHLIDPAQILVEQASNGRAFAHDPESIGLLATDYEQQGGQLQPVQVRRIAGNRVQLVLGYRRHAAAVLYNERHPDKPMKLKCLVVEINDEEALSRNVRENRLRKETTPIDDAFTQRRFREDHGWTDIRLAEFYGYSAGYVGKLKKLLTLPTDIQRQVHLQEMTVNTALDLYELTPTERQEVLTQADAPPVRAPGTIPSSNGEANGGSPGVTPVTPGSSPVVKRRRQADAVRQKVRAKRIEGGGAHPRQLREVKTFLEELTGPGEKPGLREMAKILLRFVEGGLTDKTTRLKLDTLFAEGTNP